MNGREQDKLLDVFYRHWGSSQLERQLFRDIEAGSIFFLSKISLSPISLSLVIFPPNIPLFRYKFISFYQIILTASSSVDVYFPYPLLVVKEPVIQNLMEQYTGRDWKFTHFLYFL